STATPAPNLTGHQCHHRQPRPQSKTEWLEEQSPCASESWRNGVNCGDLVWHATPAVYISIPLSSRVWHQLVSANFLRPRLSGNLRAAPREPVALHPGGFTLL